MIQNCLYFIFLFTVIYNQFILKHIFNVFNIETIRFLCRISTFSTFIWLFNCSHYLRIWYIYDIGGVRIWIDIRIALLTNLLAWISVNLWEKILIRICLIFIDFESILKLMIILWIWKRSLIIIIVTDSTLWNF